MVDSSSVLDLFHYLYPAILAMAEAVESDAAAPAAPKESDTPASKRARMAEASRMLKGSGKGKDKDGAKGKDEAKERRQDVLEPHFRHGPIPFFPLEHGVELRREG